METLNNFLLNYILKEDKTMADNTRRQIPDIKIEGAKLIFKNFQGKGNDYNKEGDRNFGVLLPDDIAEVAAADGWRVKHRPPREEDGYEQPWLSVKVKYGQYPPIINLITSKGKQKITEETVGQLDWTQIKNVDLIIRPYNYPAMTDKSGKVIRESGISAYLKSMYVTVLEDDLAQKYADIPDLDEPVEEEAPFN